MLYIYERHRTSRECLFSDVNERLLIELNARIECVAKSFPVAVHWTICAALKWKKKIYQLIRIMKSNVCVIHEEKWSLWNVADSRNATHILSSQFLTF